MRHIFPLDSQLDFDLLIEKPFLIEFVQTILPWNVRRYEIDMIDNKYDYIKAHYKGCGCILMPTRRIMGFPLIVVYHLAFIEAPCAERIFQFLGQIGHIYFEPFNPVITKCYSTNLLEYVFKLFYEERFRGQNIDPQLITDYYMLCCANDIPPNLKIRSYKRLIKEHDVLAARLNITSIDEFTILPTVLLPDEAEGYFFKQITSKDLLLVEATEMKHCVAYYAQQIRDGSSLIFSISGKERATAEFTEASSNLNQVFSFRNEPVSQTLIDLLKSYLRNPSGRIENHG